MTQSKNIPQAVLQLLRKSEDSKLSGNYEDAIKYAEEALSKDPTCIEALEEIADNYLALDKIDKAQAAAKFAISLDKDSYTALYILGFIESRESNFKEAIKLLEQANKNRPNHPEILRALGWAYFMQENTVKGKIILERALNLAPEDITILCDLGLCYMKDSDSNKALDLFYRAMELNPNDERVQECIQIAEQIQTIKSK